jgi:hypothetical protein
MSSSRALQRRGAAILLLSVTVVAGACSHRPETAPRADTAWIIFSNESLEQADLFAVAPGIGSRKLGTVFSGRTDTLKVSGALAMTGGLSLVARTLTGSTAGSGSVALHAGEALRVRLPLDRKQLVVLPNM